MNFCFSIVFIKFQSYNLIISFSKDKNVENSRDFSYIHLSAGATTASVIFYLTRCRNCNWIKILMLVVVSEVADKGIFC